MNTKTQNIEDKEYLISKLETEEHRITYILMQENDYEKLILSTHINNKVKYKILNAFSNDNCRKKMLESIMEQGKTDEDIKKYAKDCMEKEKYLLHERNVFDIIHRR